MRLEVITAILGLLAAQVVPKLAAPDLSGTWNVASATVSRRGEASEQPSKQLVTEYMACDCGHECRVTYKNSTLTVESAKLDDGATAVSAEAVFVIDRRTRS